MTLYQARRNQLIIAALSSLLLGTLWWVGDLPTYMYVALPFVIAALWIPALLVRQHRQGSIFWNTLIGGVGIAVVVVVARAVWLIGRG